MIRKAGYELSQSGLLENMNLMGRFLAHCARGLSRLVVLANKGECPIERKPTRIAVLLDSGIGDTLMATPMLRELRRQLPHATILGVVNAGTAQVIARNLDVDGLCVFRQSGESTRFNWSALRALRRFRPEVMIVPQTGNILVQIFAAWYSRAPIRVKHRFHYPPERKYSDFEFLFTRSPEVGRNEHRVKDNLKLLSAVNLENTGSGLDLEFPVSPWSTQHARTLLESKGWDASQHSLCMHPGVGTATLNKQWPVERFAELAKRLAELHAMQIVLVGGKGEIDLCRQIQNEVGRCCFVVSGECSLEETAAVIQLCHLFVSNDSGLMHLAAAMKAKGVALFGPTDPAKIGPLGGDLKVIYADSIQALSVDKVFETIEDHFLKTESKSPL